MKTSRIILVNGALATGKSVLSKKLAAHFGWPLITKDVFKEIIFDEVGYSDRAFSAKVGAAAFKISDYIIEQELRSGHDIVAETWYKPEYDDEKFQNWQAKYHAKIVQVLCFADDKVVTERFRQRVTSGERHPGHVDLTHELLDAQTYQGKIEPLHVDGTLTEVDTTDFAKVDEAKIIQEIESAFA